MYFPYFLRGYYKKCLQNDSPCIWSSSQETWSRYRFSVMPLWSLWEHKPPPRNSYRLLSAHSDLTLIHQCQTHCSKTSATFPLNRFYLFQHFLQPLSSSAVSVCVIWWQVDSQIKRLCLRILFFIDCIFLPGHVIHSSSGMDIFS